MIGIERLYKLIVDIDVSADPELWYILRGGTEGDWDCEEHDDKTLGSTLVDIADQIKREQGGRVSRMRVLAVVTEMERHVSGVEGAEDSPVARWARELRGALSGRADEEVEDVATVRADAMEAWRWVREHGGLDRVRAEWSSRVPYDRYVRRRQSLLGHIAECETALGRRNRRIEELEGRVNDLTNENAELRRRAMPEGCDEEFIKLHMSNLRGFMFDVMDRLGVDKSDSDAPEIVFDALDRRLMPEGMEWLVEAWPRYESGESVGFGNDVSRHGEDFEANVIALYRDGSFSLNFWAYSKGERVKRPSVLAADGEPLEVGQTVYATHYGYVKCTVLAIEWVVDGYLVEVENEGGHKFRQTPDEFTHQRPVLAADGEPLEAGQTVWDENGDELVIGALEDGGHTVTCRYADVGDGIPVHGMWAPSDLTHQRPVLDADGAPIRKGDTVWHIETGREYVVVEPSYGETVVVRLAKYDDAEGEQYAPDQLTHAKPEIDGWERIEEDALNFVEDNAVIPHDQDQMKRDMLAILRRCRALAERERGE